MAKGQRAKTKSRGTEVKRQRVEDDSQDDPATKRPRLDTLLPPHSVKVRFMLKRLDVRVDLSARFCEICFYLTPVRIPDNCINLDCSETTFHLDTLKYSKKFVLEYNSTFESSFFTIASSIHKESRLILQKPQRS